MSDLLTILREGSTSTALSGEHPDAHQRLWTALQQQNLGASDLVCLLRAVHRSEQVINPDLAVPLELHSNWLSHPDLPWERAGLQIVSHNSQSLRLQAQPWCPTWLDTDQPVDTPLYEETRRRHDPTAPGDPLLNRFGFQTYQSEAQRQVVRSVCCAPSSATIVVNLPTGSGKTLCGLVEARFPSKESPAPPGVTPIIVPTVALALDLQHRLSALIDHPTAYRPDSSEAETVRIRVEAGTQGPLFASPESLIGSLRRPLIKSAEKGLLRCLVVDEAHMISAWGDEFRPAFQQIAGMRRELLEHATSPFKTILASATLTEYHLQSLQNLFAEPGPFQVMHAVRLRPEPSWWMCRASSEEQRRERLMEAIYHLPRPLILYTTKREQAQDWHRRLREERFSRIGLMTGSTPDRERERLLQQWQEDRLDIMVATSAFGLGVDKREVRAVLHASLPEGVDRLYQDVGRGGRDGRASLSLLIHCDDDWATARSLMVPTFIGQEKGSARWATMFNSPNRIQHDNHSFSVPITEVPRWVGENNDENERWNVRTLLLMARAGLLELAPPPLTSGQSSNDRTEDVRRVSIRLKRVDHLDEKVWTEEIEHCRGELKTNGDRGMRLLNRVVSGEECVGAVLQSCYLSENPPISVIRACGGCLHCRASGYTVPFVPLRPRYHPLEPWQSCPPREELSEFLIENRLGIIYYPGSQLESSMLDEIAEVVEWTLDQGAMQLISGSQLQSRIQHRAERIVLIDHQIPHRELVSSRQGMVLVHGEEDGPDWRSVWKMMQSPHTDWAVLFLPYEIKQPDHAGRLVREVFTSVSMTLATWQEEYDL